VDTVIVSLDSINNSLIIIQKTTQESSFFWDIIKQFIGYILTLGIALLLLFLGRYLEKREKIWTDIFNLYIKNGTSVVFNYIESINQVLRKIIDLNDLKKPLETYEIDRFPREASLNICQLLNSFGFLRFMNQIDHSYVILQKKQMIYLSDISPATELQFEIFILISSLQHAMDVVLTQLLSIPNQLEKSSKSVKSVRASSIISPQRIKNYNSCFKLGLKQLVERFKKPMKHLELLPPNIKSEYDRLYGTI